MTEAAAPDPEPPGRFAERPLLVPSGGERLLGLLHPAGGALGVVMIVGGPQYRAGSHRHFVQCARALAADGIPVLRIDTGGMGDSTGPLRSFEHLTPDIGAAITAFTQAQPQVDRVVLWGLCDAASAALLYLHERPDPRVAALGLLNPWVRSAQSLARTQVRHYYLQRLAQPDFWRKLLSGRVAADAIIGLWRSLRLAGSKGTSAGQQAGSFQTRMAAAWRGFDGPIWLLLSGRDYTAKEFLAYADADPAWAGLLASPRVTRVDITDADHTLSEPAAAAQAEASLRAWLRGLPPARGSDAQPHRPA